jgi:endoglucanase Acf2
MKTIIERRLSLNHRYTLIDKQYIPLVESIGTCCDNCGQLIANIATVRNEAGTVYNIGFDCLETILINNNLLSGKDIDEYQRVKKMIPKILRFSKSIKETLTTNSNANITGIRFEKQSYPSEYYAFYWLKAGQLTSRDNDFVKLKEVDILFLIDTLKNIFPRLTFLYN